MAPRGRGGARVYIDGDESGLRASLQRGERALDRFGGVGEHAFGGMRAGALAAGAAVTALTVGAVRLGTDSVKAALDAEAAMAKVKRMVENTGFAWKEHAAQIDRVIQAQSRLTGLDDEDLAQSFANLLRATKDINEAFKLNALAADIARSKGVDLAGAQSLLARVYNGSFMGVKRLGIEIKPVTAAQDDLRRKTDHATDAQKRAAKETDALATRQKAIALLQKNFGGQAVAYANTSQGAIDRLNVAWENVKETIGTAALPAVKRFGDVLSRDVLPQVEGAAGQIGKVLGSELDFGTKLEKSWDVIAQTGLPDRARDALLEGFAYVGSHAPVALFNAFEDSPGWGKVAIGALLLAKFGPAFKLLGGGLGKALGGAGIAGGIGGAVGSMKPVPVVVVNGGLDRMTNVRGAPGGIVAPGAAGAFGARAAGGIALRGLGGIGLAVGGGLLLQDLAAGGNLGPLGALFPSDARVKKEADRFTSRTISAWRKSAGDVEAFVAAQRERSDLVLFPTGEQAQRDAAASAAAAVEGFRRTLAGKGPTLNRTGAGLAKNALAGLSTLEPQARQLAEDSIVRMAISLERSGKAPRGSVQRLVDAMKRKFGELPLATQHAVDAYIDQVNRIPEAIAAVSGNVTSAVGGLVQSLTDFKLNITTTAQVPTQLRASGGFIPGPAGAGDIVPALLSPGEVVLNAGQQAMVGPGRILSALSATGGVIGGGRFAKGGVAAAVEFGRAQLNDPYVFGAGHSFGDHGSWDCSGLAANVAARVPGYAGGFGDTDTLFSSSSSATGREPVLWGFTSPGAIQNGVRKRYGHMFVKVGGQVFNAHSPSIGIDQRASPGAVWRVPPGLAGYDAGDGLDPKAGDKRQQARNRKATGRAISQALADIGPAFDAPTGLSGAESRDVSSAGRRAYSIARGKGATVTQALEAKDDAERTRSIEWYQGEKAKAILRRKQVNNQLATARHDLKDASKSKAPRTRKDQVKAAIKRRMKDLLDERRGLNEWIAEINSQLFDLGVQADQDREDDHTEAATPPDGNDNTPPDNTPSTDQQAEVDRAEAAAAKAQARADTADSFIRTITGSGDIGSGGPDALTAAGGVTVLNINTLVPGSPQANVQLAGVVAAALAAQGGVLSPMASVGP